MIKLKTFIDEVYSLDDDEIAEKLIRKKIIRNGKLKRVKRSNLDGFTSQGGKEKKQSAGDKIKRSRSQKRGAVKRRSKKTIAAIKKKKSNRIRKSMGL